MYHLIIYAPEEAANAVREAASAAGAGNIGNYDSCSFSSKGIGRFRPLEGATPAIGTVDEVEEVAEERIEFMVTEQHIRNVLTAIVNVHPYEEPAIHVLQMQDYRNLLDE